MSRTLVRDLVHYRERFGEIVAGSLMFRSFMLILVLLSILIWKSFLPPTKTLSWGVIGVVTSSCLLSLDLGSVYDAWKSMKRHAIYNLVQKCLYFVIIWVTIIFCPERISISLIACAMLVAAIVYLVIQHQWALKRIVFQHVRQSLVKVALTMGRQNFLVFLTTAGGLLISSLNQLILNHFCGTSELGGYAAAWQVVSLAMLLLAQISRIGSPEAARITRQTADKSQRIRFLTRYTAVMFIAAALVGIPASVFPELVLRTVFRPEYTSAAGIMRVLGIYIMVFSLGVVASQYVISAYMEKLYFLSVIFGGCLSVILCLLLIPELQGFGAALTVLISHGGAIAFYLMGMIKHIRSIG